jgi:hypothetical protein
MRTFNRYLLIALLAGVIVVSMVGVFRIREMVRPRILARVSTPDGVEMCVIQKCNFSAEMFTTSFLYRRPSDVWRWFYYDHEDGYWSASQVKIDPEKKVAVFLRDQQPAITFDWANEDYTLHRFRRTDHQGSPADPGWSPEQFLSTREK